MKKSMKTAILVVVGLAVLGMGLHHAYAAVSNEESLSSLNPFLKRSYAGLGLTDQQITAIKAVVKQNLLQIKAMSEQIIMERRALKSLIRAEAMDEPAIRAQVAKVAALEADRCVKRAFIGREIRGILTPEQINKAKEMRIFRERLVDRRIARVYKWFEE
ncbi:MAG: Spy/CpxP family protein refolding chaperone [Deltaproteobacteria bacterium]|nr:Spy/CpxP family protein refolding chaperone [Deltaproteobacteria bacterium]